MIRPVNPPSEPERDGVPSVPRSGSTARRLALGIQLRRLRASVGMDRRAAGATLRASAAKISRLETGRVGFKQRDVADLLTLYGVTDETERAGFLDLAREANTPGWWQPYADVLPRWFETYLGLEQSCSVLRIYELQFVHGLFQTPAYAREVITLGHADPDEVQRRVQLRMRRQAILTEPGGPVVWAVIDETALSRPLANRQLCRDQLDHLMELTELPNVQVQVAPFSQGGHAAAGGGFTILRFAEPELSDIIYMEHLTGALYLDGRADLERHRSVMDCLCAQVPPPEQTRDALMDIRARI